MGIQASGINGGKAPVKVEVVTKKITYSLYETGARSLESQIKNVLKAVKYTLFFAGNVAPALGAQLGNFKNILSCREFYEGIPRVYSTFCRAVSERTASVFQEVFLDSGKLFNTLADAIELTNVFVPLNAAICKLIQRSNCVVTGVCATFGAVKEMGAFIKADREGNAEQQTLSLLRLAMCTSYVAFAAISMGCLAMGIQASAVTIISCLASGTLFGLLSFAYESMNDPYGKNYEAHRKLESRVQVA